MLATFLSCIAVDDDPIVPEIMGESISNTDRLELKGLIQPPIEALQYIQKEKTGVIFIDNQIPLVNRPDFIQSLLHPTQFILPTAYLQRAMISKHSLTWSSHLGTTVFYKPVIN